MTNFSIDDRLAPVSIKPGNLAAKIQALAEEYETKPLVDSLDEIYRLADSLADERHKCRQCARCCNQAIRPLAAYAVEIAYLAGNAAAENIPVVDEAEELCPGVGENGACKFYLKRMLGCRLFLPFADWAEATGCANYPHAPESLEKIRYLLNLVEGLNQQFIWALGLHRDFDFDYLAHWAVTTWFSPIGAVTATRPSWGL